MMSINPLEKYNIVLALPPCLTVTQDEAGKMLKCGEATIKYFFSETKLIKTARNRVLYEDVIKIARFIHSADFPENILSHKERDLWVKTFLNVKDRVYRNMRS